MERERASEQQVKADLNAVTHGSHRTLQDPIEIRKHRAESCLPDLRAVYCSCDIVLLYLSPCFLLQIRYDVRQGGFCLVCKAIISPGQPAFDSANQ